MQQGSSPASASDPFTLSSNSSTDLSDSRIRTISSIISICERTTINIEKEGISNMVKAIVIISLKYVNKEALFKAILPDMFIDWDYVRNQSIMSSGKKNFLGDSASWLNLVHFMDFGALSLPDPVLQTKYPPLHCLHTAITKASGTRGKLDFGDACKLLILNNIDGLTSKMMIEHHTSSRMNCNTHAICSGIVSALADERHSSDVYEDTFKYVIGTLMNVNEKALADNIAHYKQTKMARDKAWILKAVQSKICRPSMRRVAAAMVTAKSEQRDVFGNGGPSNMVDGRSSCGTSVMGNTMMGNDGTGVLCITFEQHSQFVRYPNSMSNLRRLRCYLLACQGHHVQYQNFLDELVPKDVALALADSPVTIPDSNSVFLGIDSLAMNVRPFDELNQFRTKCFISFASHQKRDLSLTQVLKLYVAAYQVRCTRQKRAGAVAVILFRVFLICNSLHLAGQDHLEARMDIGLPRHIPPDHPRRGDVCGVNAICHGAILRDTKDQFSVFFTLNPKSRVMSFSRQTTWHICMIP
jgi:hypothetical protein